MPSGAFSGALVKTCVFVRLYSREKLRSLCCTTALRPTLWTKDKADDVKARVSGTLYVSMSAAGLFVSIMSFIRL